MQSTAYDEGALPAAHVPVALRALAALAAIVGHHAFDLRIAAVLALKQAAKTLPAALRSSPGAGGSSSLSDLVAPLLGAVKDTNIRVKMGGERALLHALQIHSRPATLDEFVNTHARDAATARFVRDYARRVLVRLAQDSGDEE